MSTLIPELLSEIFIIYARRNRERYNLKWIRFLLVCRHWYEVAVSTPELWSYIKIYYSRWDEPETNARELRRADIQRQRSRHWPLTVIIDLRWEVPENVLARLSTLCDPCSLSSLTVSGNRECISEVLKLLKGHRHPVLMQLAIQAMFVCELADAYSLPESIHEHTPNLRSLSIENVFPKWDLITGLRRLSAVYFMDDQMTFGLSDILDALARCPLLEHLEIRLPPAFQPAASNRDRGSPLHNLGDLSIVGSKELCHHLLQVLPGLPPTAKIAITDRIEPNWLREPPSLRLPSSVSYIENHMSHNEAPVIRTLAVYKQPIVLHSWHTYTFGAMAEPGRPSNKYRLTEQIPRLQAESYAGAFSATRSRTDLEMINGILLHWPLNQVTYLDVRITSPLVSGVWDALLTKLPAVTTVVVNLESDAIASLLHVLYLHLHASNRRLVREIICDASAQEYSSQPGYIKGIDTEALARLTLLRILLFCDDACRAGIPLDTIEVLNDQIWTHNHYRRKSNVIDCRAGNLDWSELYKDLVIGFIYGGTLYNANTAATR